MSRRFLFVLLGLTLAVYARAIGFEFLSWDDRVFIQENPLLQMPFIEALKAAFFNFFFGDYLPLTQISLWLDTLAKGAPHSGVSHGMNIALHLTNVSLLFLLLSFERSRKNPWITELAAVVMLLFFALHPLQVESVAWVSERKGLLSALFALAALNFFVRGGMVAYTLSFFASTLCKTSNLALPLVGFAYDRWINKQSMQTALIKQIPALAIAIAVGSLRVFAYANHTAGMADVFSDPRRWLFLPIQISNAVGFYLRQMLLPYGLSPIYPPFQLEPTVAINVAVFLVFLFFTWRARNNVAAPLLFAITVFLLLPVLQIVPRLSYVNDRYFYMPLWATAGLFVSLFPSRPEKTPMATLIAITLFMVTTTSRQLDLWSADLPFWTKTAQLRPDSGMAFLSLGQAYEKENDFTAAAAAYEKAADLGPEVRARALSNLSSLHADSGHPLLYDLARAEGYLQQALQSPDIRSEKPGLMYNLARLRFLQGHTEEAARMCQALIIDIDSRHDLRFENLKALAQKCFH